MEYVRECKSEMNQAKKNKDVEKHAKLKKQRKLRSAIGSSPLP